MAVALFSNWYGLTVIAWLMNVPIIELSWIIRIAFNHFIYPCGLIALSSAASPSGTVVSGKKVLGSAASTESVSVPMPFRVVNSLRN